MADQAGPFTGLTQQDQKLIMGAFKSLKGGFEVDYSKLAENMEWFAKDDAAKPNAKKANNAWLATRKKLFPDGMPAGAAPEGGAAKVKTPATPRKKKERDASKTPQAKKSTAKKGNEEAGGDEEDATTKSAPKTNGMHGKTGATVSTKATDSEAEETGEADLKNGDKVAAPAKEPSAADGDTRTENLNAGKPAEFDPSTPITKTSVAEEMSSGSISPTASSAKTKATTPATPKAKATPNKRKTKAEKEAEAAVADGEDGGEGDADGKPAAKKRKSNDGKAVVQSGGDKEAVDGASDDGESTKPTPVKTPRKPSAAQLAKREEKGREKAAKKAEKEKEKADKKAEKEREKVERQAVKKAAKTPAKAGVNGKNESLKTKTPRKPSAVQQTKKVEEESEKTSQEAEDQSAADAKAASLALAAQEMINKKADDVFNGARIDKPASNATEDHAEMETTAGDDDAPKTIGFVAINSDARRDGSTAASETVNSTVEGTQEDGDTVAVAKEKVNAVEIELGNETVVVAGEV